MLDLLPQRVMLYTSKTGTFIKLMLLGAMLLDLTACSFVGHMAKEGMLSLTERSGREHFTLAGSLPANFELSAISYYQVLDEEKCQVRDFTSRGTSTRVMATQQDTELKDHPHTFSLEIPLTHHIGLCDSEMSRVKLQIKGHYGEEIWNQDRHGGGIAVVDTRPPDAPNFANDGTMLIRGMCTWMFQISRINIGIDKLLHCSQPEENWSQDYDLSKRRGLGVTLGRDELAGKTVILEIREDPQERPAIRETWIQFPEGWKPCAEEQTEQGKWIWCRNPPTFRTFQMNGQECTVYPNCTE
ncbi:MAG: hypothetical protein CVV16_02030 [Gammaproteobacteria bacterium HGW-Gammaproteobacteria-6]|nr:MAG: hypothetical protein CVV16_02030 [Gammaproteobacteria bacterium HGW-Gammaproteobacteria-6]